MSLTRAGDPVAFIFASADFVSAAVPPFPETRSFDPTEPFVLTPNLSEIDDLNRLQAEIPACRLCPRLNVWREQTSRDKVARFRHWDYWGRPVPSLGRDDARLLVVGLAPAAHGANRTGRMFTGDRSGEWLYGALHRHGFASHPQSTHRQDPLKLIDCYITAVIHCAPPSNKPSRQEIRNCRPYLQFEWERLKRVRVVLALGRIAFDNVWDLYRGNTRARRPRFSHGLEVPLSGDRLLLASFHPSQQNTFTGKLTQPMFDSVFRRIRQVIDAG